MAEDTSFRLSVKQEANIVDYAAKCQSLLLNQFDIRNNLETIDRYYMREDDWTKENWRARLANRMGDKNKLQNVTVPVVMPQVEAALGYMANVFCTGYPIFGVGSDPANANAALQMETIVAENSITAGWVRQLLIFFRDGLKYNLHALEVDWGQKTTPVLETDLAKANSAGVKNVIWNGNIIKRLDLYNTFFDPRVHPADIYCDGEFAGYIEMFSRPRMKKYCNDLFGEVSVGQVEKALESELSSGINGGSTGVPWLYYVPMVNPYPLMNRQNLQSFDWMAWANNTTSNKSEIRYSNVYQVMTLYARIIPADFDFNNITQKNTPQVWKFVIVNGKVVLQAKRLSNAHGMIPMLFGQPLEDGLDYQTKSFGSNVMDMQDVASAMWNGFIASKRRLVGDRALYDPMRVREKDINNTDPAAKIPVRPSAYGKPVSEAVYQFPFHDEATASLLQGSQLAVNMANQINNQNPAQQGQFVKGNKTRKEYEDIMGRGNAHNQVMALMSEAQVFTPLKEIIKLNILQYQQNGVIFNREVQKDVNIDIVELRKIAVQFKVSDGLTPSDKMLSTDELAGAVQALANSPQLAQQYNLAPAFSYLYKSRGVDLRPFEKPQIQVMYEQQVAMWQQAAAEATAKGLEFKAPMPQIPPELAQMQQQSPNQSPTAAALASTQGNTNAEVT